MLDCIVKFLFFKAVEKVNKTLKFVHGREVDLSGIVYFPDNVL